VVPLRRVERALGGTGVSCPVGVARAEDYDPATTAALLRAAAAQN
jgi:hypothetical protein